MTDNELFSLIMSTLEPLIQAKFPTATMLQKEQPTQQGVPTQPTVYFEKLFDKRYGFTREDMDLSMPSDPTLPIPTDYLQLYETTIQFSAWVLQNPEDLSIPTASDLVNHVAMLLSADAILKTLRAGGANVERITNVGNPYIVDDRERFEATPSFDVVMQHQRKLSLTTPAITAVDAEIYPV
jgi:hypothetical protein